MFKTMIGSTSPHGGQVHNEVITQCFVAFIS